MTRMSRKSSYLCLAVAGVAAILLALPVGATETPPQDTDISWEPYEETIKTARLDREAPDEANYPHLMQTSEQSDLKEDIRVTGSSPDVDPETDRTSRITIYERVEITPNEELAGVVMHRTEERIWADDFVRRPGET